MTRVSLINPSFVAPVVAVAIMLLALTVLRRSPSWRQRLVLTTGLVVALICGVAAAVAVFRFTELSTAGPGPFTLGPDWRCSQS